MDRPCNPSETFLFTPSRFVHYGIDDGNFRYYYAYGNTQPEDLLKHIHRDDIVLPNVLLLGCGDLRSCLYTLWKNFDPIFGYKNFQGIHFSLNDYCSAVLARDVLFLYLIQQLHYLRHDEMKLKKWFCAIWAIWYSHELLPDHRQILKESLSLLHSFAESCSLWSQSSDNPLRNIVSFQEEETLTATRSMWKLWLKLCDVNVDWISLKKESPKSEFVSMNSKLMSITKCRKVLGLLSIGTCKEEVEKMSGEFEKYFKSGCVFAEVTFQLSMPSSKCENFANPTFFEKEDLYTLHYASVPYLCYFHTLQFSVNKLLKAGVSSSDMNWLKVDQASFKVYPVLANCVQQFVIWLTSSSNCLNNQLNHSNSSVSFTFQLGNAIKFLYFQKEEPQFDIVHSSNLIDTLSPPSLVLSVAPVLKKHGLLITTSLLYQMVTSCGLYMQEVFGFPTEQIPILCGMRCIGQDGKYNCEVSINPAPAYHNTLSSLGYGQGELVFVWEKVNGAMPLILPSLNDSGFAHSLHNCIRNCTTSFRTKNNDVSRGMCSHTGVLVLKSFVSQLSKSVAIEDYLFWEGFSRLIRSDEPLKPYLLHLQTQMLLSGLHIHLTLTVEDCPLCNGMPFGKSLCTVPIEFACVGLTVPFFLAFLHPSNQDLIDPIEIDALPSEFQIIDSAPCMVSSGRKLEMTVIIPQKYMDSTHKITIAASTTKHTLIGPSVTITPFCSNLLTPERSSSALFPLYQTRLSPVESSFGELTEYFVEEGYFISTVTLSVDTISCLGSNCKLNVLQLSPFSIKLICGSLNLVLTFHAPIDFNGSKIQLFRKKGLVKVTAPRTIYQFYNEQLHFINCTNKLVVPSMSISDEILRQCCGRQYTVNDKEIMARFSREPTLMPALVNLKECFTSLFQIKATRDFEFVMPSKTNPSQNLVVGILTVQNRIFNIETQSPALDVLYYYPEKISTPPDNVIKDFFLHRIFSENLNEVLSKTYITTDFELELLKKVFHYFNRRTTNTRRHSSNPKFYEHFERAIIYPLYVEEGQLTTELQEMFIDKKADFSVHETQMASSYSKSPNELKRCNFCKSTEQNLKACSRCKNAWYCGQECQKNDWPHHKELCGVKPPIIPAEKCANCGKVDCLRKCTRCRAVSYCSKECQQKDWSTHKNDCSSINK